MQLPTYPVAPNLYEDLGARPEKSDPEQADQLFEVMEVHPLTLLALTYAGYRGFMLGDTPIPQSDLHQGSSVPLPRALALLAHPVKAAQPLPSRCNVTATQVRDINPTHSVFLRYLKIFQPVYVLARHDRRPMVGRELVIHLGHR